MPQNQTLTSESASFAVSASGPELKFRHIQFADPVPTGRQIAEAFGGHQPEDYAVLHWLTEGDIVQFGLDQTIDLRANKNPRFIVAKSDRLFLFEIDDKQCAWPEPTITRDALLIIAGQDPAKFTVWQDRRKEQDLEILAGHPANLAAEGTERFYTVLDKTTEGEQ